MSDLYKLGPCLASVFPNAYFSQLSPSVFVSYYSTLGNAFQPNETQTAIAQSLILSFVSNSTLMTNTTKDTFAFAVLGDLAMFYPWTSSLYSSMLGTSVIFNILFNTF